MQIAQVVPETQGPLTEQHRQELALAHERGQKIRRAAGVAAFNGWATAIFAALSAPFAAFSLPGFFVTAGLSVVAYQEFRGRRQLLQFDPSAARLLGWNQLGLLAVIVVYSLWSIYAGLDTSELLGPEFNENPELRKALGSTAELEGIVQYLVIAIYSAVIAVSAVFQGGNAWYYFSRRKYVEAYLRETPAWAVDVQQMSAVQ